MKLELAKQGDALAPAEVGYYMDVLQGRLKQVVQNEVTMTRYDDHIVIKGFTRLISLSGHLQEDAGFVSVLAPLAEVLIEFRKTVLIVRVRPVNNRLAPALAEQCALAITHQFEKAGVVRKRLAVAGAGAAPAAPETSGVQTAPSDPVQFELDIEPVLRAQKDG